MEAVRAQQAAEKLAAELAAQRIKAAQAAHAAGPQVTQPALPPAWSNPPPNGRSNSSLGISASSAAIRVPTPQTVNKSASPLHRSKPPRNGHSSLPPAANPPRTAASAPAVQTVRKTVPTQARFAREPHTRLPVPGVAARFDSRPPTPPKPAVATVRRPVVKRVGEARAATVATRPAVPAVRRAPVRTRPAWQARMRATIVRVAKNAAGAAARSANKAAKEVAKATARTATTAARQVARTTVRTAKKAVQAARARREAKRTPAKAIPVLTRPVVVSSQPRTANPFPRRPAPVVAARRRPPAPGPAPAPPATRPAVKPMAPRAMPVRSEVRQGTRPSPAFREAQAAKIEKAVEAARARRRRRQDRVRAMLGQPCSGCRTLSVRLASAESCSRHPGA